MATIACSDQEGCTVQAVEIGSADAGLSPPLRAVAGLTLGLLAGVLAAAALPREVDPRRVVADPAIDAG
jgi:hypothetical protein